MSSPREKLDESRFFFDSLSKEATRTHGTYERVGYFFSAFLSAGRSVSLKLRELDQRAHDAWVGALPEHSRLLFHAMRSARDTEVHRVEEVTTTQEESIRLGPGTFEDEWSTTIVSGPPLALLGENQALVTIHRPRWYVDVDEERVDVVDAAADYLDVLNRLVEDLA